jgi:hypothetical protein
LNLSPFAEVQLLDLVAKLPTRQPVPGPPPGQPEHWLALVHIEIESPDKATPLRPRMFRSYVHLRAKHGVPVLPIALFLRVGLEGIGVDVYEAHFFELRPVRFEYLYVGLPGLDGVQYVQGDNWLGVALAALMRIPKERVAWLGAEALRRIKDAPVTEQQRFLLAECVQAYLPLDAAQQREFERLVASAPYHGVQAMNVTWYEKGLEKGLEKGRREMLRTQLEERFGPLPTAVVERLEQMPGEQLLALGKALVRAHTLADLGLED